MCLLLSVQAPAQESFVYRSFAADLTLRNQTVTALTQSTDGFIWIGTTHGLFRYDGHQFIHWHSGAGREGLISPFVTDLLPEGDRYLWIATKEGLSRLDRTVDTFAHYTKRSVHDFPSKILHSITPDPLGRGLWLLGDNRNPVLFQAETGIQSSIRWKEFIAEQGISDKVYLNTNRMVSSADGRHLWLGTNIGLFQYELYTEQLKFLGGKRPNGRLAECTSIWEDKQGRVYVNVGGGGLMRYDPPSDTWAAWDVFPDAPTATDVFYGWSLQAFRDSLLLAGTTEGLMVFNTLRETFRVERNSPDQLHSISGGGVLSLFADDAGLVWVGTQQGLSRIDPLLQQFNRVQVYASRDTVVQALWQHPGTGQVLLAPRGKGPLRVWSPNTSQATYLYAPGPGSVFFEEVQAFAADEQDGLWFCDRNRLFRLDLKTWNLEERTLPTAAYGFTDIQYTQSNGLFLSARYAGAMHYDTQSGILTQLKAADFDLGVQINSCYWDDRTRALWLPSNWGLLARYHPETGVWNDFRHIPEQPNTLASELPRRLQKGLHHDLWIITEPGGISRYWLEADSFSNYFTAQGLPVNLFDDLMPDSEGQLWLKYQHKLCRWHPETGQARVYDWRYGLELADWGSYFHQNKQGQLLLGTVGGFLLFDPTRLSSNTSSPRPKLLLVEASNRTLPLVAGQPIELSHHEHTLHFHFAALSFQLSEELRYFHLLEGADTDWLEASAGRTALYANLPPGVYRFRLRVLNSDGVEAELASPLIFRIRPHFSQTPVFRLLLLLLIVGAVFAVYRYRMNRVLEMERLRNRIAGDLHDDIASTISSISFYSAFAAEEAKEIPKLRAVLETIGNNSREALDKMRDIVWTIRSTDTTGLDLFQRMEYFGRGLCETKGIQFSIRGQANWGQKNLSPDMKKQLLLIFKEVLNNALKYSNCGHFEVIAGRVGQTRHWMEFRDDGVGFDPDEVRSGTGLQSLRWRVQQLGGEWQLRSTPGLGTSIRVSW